MLFYKVKNNIKVLLIQNLFENMNTEGFIHEPCLMSSVCYRLNDCLADILTFFFSVQLKIRVFSHPNQVYLAVMGELKK